jgi:hypothetical protein
MTTTENLTRRVILRSGDITTEPIRRFIQTTLLADCTTMTTIGGGATEVYLESPGILSSTEERLWLLLVDMTQGILRDLANYGDATHRTAVADVVAGVMDVHA